MNILVHICCGPCGIMPLTRLLEEGHNPAAWFFNPNIHPLAEYLRRREGAQAVAARLGVPILFADALPEESCKAASPALSESPFSGRLHEAVDPVDWLRAVSGKEKDRCSFCWNLRLSRAAAFAAANGFEAFTSSLLYSRYQNHEALRRLGEESAAAHGIAFHYVDFRTDWQAGIDRSKEWGIYRQPYCGCIYSEYDRYAKQWAKAAGPQA